MSQYRQIFVDTAGNLFSFAYNRKPSNNVTISGNQATAGTTARSGRLTSLHVDDAGHLYQRYQGRWVSVGTSHAFTGHIVYPVHVQESDGKVYKKVKGQYLPLTVVA